MPLSKALKETIAHTARPTDKRGLLPLAVARKILAATKVYPGGWVDHPGRDARERANVEKSHEIHAALVSLEDADEALAHLTRIVWQLPLFGAPTLVERFGAAVLPWFAGAVKHGNLEPMAWGTEEALPLLGVPEALEVLLKAKLAFYDDAGAHKQGVANVADLPELDAKAEVESDIEQAIDQFIANHPVVAAQVIGARLAKSPRDKRMKALVKRLPKAARHALPGGAPAEEKLTAKAILEVLDAAAKRPEVDSWPRFATGIEDDPDIHEYHALRLIGVRARTGEGWGVVIERITGSFSPYEPTRINRFVYGSSVRAPGTMTEHKIDFVLDRIPDQNHGETLDTNLDGVVVKGPAGKAKLSNALVKKLDLKPGMGCELEGDAGFNLRLRAYLALHPTAFWEDATKVVKALDLRDPEVIVDTHAFRHVVGATYKRLAKSASWHGLPSKCPTYQSLAAVLVSRKKKDFDPGEPNVDVRLHAVHKTAA